MPLDRFINERKTAWQRLEELLHRVDHMSLRRLHREEVRELGRIYRRTASDLAIARAESRDPRLVNYLNSLVIRAHGRIYRAETHGLRRMGRFFTHDFPQAFRATWRFTLIGAAFFWIFFVVGFSVTMQDQEFSEIAGVPAIWRAENTDAHRRWWLEVNKQNQIASAAIGTNNIKVGFNAFALGAFFGVGTLYIMSFNGIINGAILALTYRAGYGNELVTFMIGHGVIELSCIFMAGGAGLMIGSAILMPGDVSRADSMKSKGLQAIILIIGCTVLLIVAAIIKAFISPAPISPIIKFGIGILTGIAMYSYLMLAGREESKSDQNV
jgi:uncharacterized membrane protein SpoIIM required for sporulation